ncbi:MAG TPA: neutral/alkaline non-lysosomal ceramidase N-terminal domain-containing protein, partial [Chloroflexota bacterium]|nr:neutral/alkaline non-lysosomal ceramidase N-terminal domain-containing protein [Chloroflexota bacterium]
MTSSPTLQVGAARYAITPPLGVSLAGSYADRRAAGFHDDLYARALVIDDGAAQIAIVSCDLIGINATTVAHARRIVQERCGIPGDHVLIHATHNHSGPLTRDLTISGMYGEVDDGYLAELERHIAAAVEAAFARRAPARLHLSLGECRGIAFNRRFRMRSGPVRTNAGKLNPEIVETAAPVDERLWTLTALPPAPDAANG